VTEEIIARADDELLFTYRHFPMSTIHPHATTAAEAAEAAGSQRRFWEMHALLFADQHRLEPVDLVARADALRLDVNRFVEELRSRAHNPKVRSDFLSGVRSGVNGTPTFFVNGRRHDGPADLTSLLAALRDAKQRPEKITGPGGEGHAQRRRAAAGVGQPRPAPGAPRPPGRS
jgi:protein-disulfide isomerase